MIKRAVIYEFRLDDRFPKGYCHGLRSERKLTQELSCTWKTAIPVSGIGGQPLRLRSKRRSVRSSIFLVASTSSYVPGRRRLDVNDYGILDIDRVIELHIRTAPVYWLSPSTLIEGRSAR